MIEWLQNHLKTWQGMVGILTGAIGVFAALWASVWQLTQWVRKATSVIKEFCESAAFLMDVKAEISSMRKDFSDRLDKVDEGQLHIIQNRRIQQDASPNPWFEADRNGRYTWVNRAWCRLTGMDVAQALGYGWLNGVHEDDRDRVGMAWERAMEQERIYEGRYRLVDRHGEATEPLTFVATPVKRNDPAQTIMSYTGSSQLFDETIILGAAKTKR